MTREAQPDLEATGAITLDESGFVISQRLASRDVEGLPPGSIERIHHGGGETHVTLKPQSIAGVRFHLNLRFADDRLLSVECMAENQAVAEVMAAGGAWTRDNELARKRFHEQWAAGVLGRALTIKPWVDPDLPEPVMPACPGPDHPLHTTFAWGEVISIFDDKGCGAYLVVRYVRDSYAPSTPV